MADLVQREEPAAFPLKLADAHDDRNSLVVFLPAS